MKYIYNPVTGTLDDVETPNLGEKYFASAETDALKDMMNEQFGPGTIKYGSEIDPPEMKTPQAIYEFGQRNPAANGGMMRQNFVAGAAVAPLLSYPATLGMAKIFGISTAGVGATELGNKVTDYLKENPEVMDTPQFRGIALAFGINIPGYIAPDADEMEREKKRIEDLEKERLKGTPPPKIEIKTGETTKPEDFDNVIGGGFGSGKKIEFPPSTGGTEIIEPKKGDNIFYSKKEYGEKALEEIDSETLTDINTIIKDYRDSKTRPAGIVTTIEGGRKRERFRPASTQPIMNEADKVELLELVIKKYKEKENKLPSGTELTALLPTLNVTSLAKKNKIELGKRIADYDRNDPKYIESQRENKQLKANENSTITNFANENFFPDTVELKDGSTVNAKEFFINNLVKRTELGPSRIGTYDTTLKNKELAKLFNTNIRKIEEVIKNIRNSPDFTADFPPNRELSFYQKQTAERIKKAR